MSRLLENRAINGRCNAVLIVCAVMLAVESESRAAIISLTSTGQTYLQDFNTLAASGSNVTWTNDSTIASWFSTELTYSAGNGSNASHGLRSFGTGTNTDRSLGAVPNGSAIQYGVVLQNNTGFAVTQVDLGYTGEQWRVRTSGAAVVQSLVVDARVSSTVDGITTPGGQLVAALQFNSPQTTPNNSAIDGNAAANRTVFAPVSQTVAWNPGQYLWVRWTDIDDANADHGLGIDDFSFAISGFTAPPVAVPEPSAVLALAAVGAVVSVRRLRSRRNSSAVV